MNTKIILVVDDEPTNISVVASLLQELYQIRVATDGESALDIVQNETPDLILLDIEMPNMSGYEVASRLKSSDETKSIPFIFLTAKNDLNSIVKGFNYGAVDYISKPFAKEELIARVSTHLKIHYLQQSLSNTINNLEDKMAEIEKSKNFLDSILSNSSHIIVTTDLKGNITLFNKKAQELLGYSRDEVIGRHTPALFHKESQMIQRAKEFSKELNIDVEPNFELFTIKTNKGLINHDEWIYISKDKDEFPVSLSITALRDLSGEINGYMGIAEDITAIKHKESLINQYIKQIEQLSITLSSQRERTK